NVNFPHLQPDEPDPDLVFCPLDHSPLPLNYHVEAGRAVYTGNYQARARRPNSDVDVCFQGRIAVTLIRVFDREPTPAQIAPEVCPITSVQASGVRPRTMPNRAVSSPMREPFNGVKSMVIAWRALGSRTLR